MDKKVIKASSLSEAGAFTVMFLLMVFNQAGDTEIGYCSLNNEICIAVDGFSGGSHTRCYNETDMDWWTAPYCSDGWQIVKDDLPPPKIEEEQEEQEPINKKGVWGTKYNCNSTGCKIIT